MRPALSSPAILLLMLTLSCVGGRTPDTGAAPTDQPRALMENRSSIDMDVFLIRNDGQSIRLGFVPGGDSATFPLPPTITAGAPFVTFEARPVRRSGQTIRSEPFSLQTGEEIFWSISPQ